MDEFRNCISDYLFRAQDGDFHRTRLDMGMLLCSRPFASTAIATATAFPAIPALSLDLRLLAMSRSRQHSAQ